MNFGQKKRFMRESLHISSKGLTQKDVNSFFKKIASLKNKYQ
jgi:hypothetical protein